MGLFIEVILPVFSVFIVGFILQRFRVLDVKSVAAVSVYIFMPALFFSSLYKADFGAGYGIIILSIFVVFFAMILLNKLCKIIFRWPNSVETGSILGTAFMNGGNYGLPVILFCFGEKAMPFAIFYVVIQSLVIHFFGVYYAHRELNGFVMAIKKIFKMPGTYAALFAYLLQKLPWQLPETVFGTIKMVGDASIPLMMVVLGMQLANIKKFKFNWQVITVSVVLRMIVSPLIAWIYITVFQIDPIIGGVILVISAMPSAASMVMYAIEFDAEPELVSSITLVTTLFSMISLTVLLNILI